MEVSIDKYKLVKTFVMDDGYIFYAYERIVPADKEEVMKYLDAFSQENENYPDLFSDVIDEYIRQKNL